jgi:hypothetical protein
MHRYSRVDYTFASVTRASPGPCPCPAETGSYHLDEI